MWSASRDPHRAVNMSAGEYPDAVRAVVVSRDGSGKGTQWSTSRGNAVIIPQMPKKTRKTADSQSSQRRVCAHFGGVPEL